MVNTETTRFSNKEHLMHVTINDNNIFNQQSWHNFLLKLGN